MNNSNILQNIFEYDNTFKEFYQNKVVKDLKKFYSLNFRKPSNIIAFEKQIFEEFIQSKLRHESNNKLLNPHEQYEICTLMIKNTLHLNNEKTQEITQFLYTLIKMKFDHLSFREKTNILRSICDDKQVLNSIKKNINLIS